MEKVILVRYGEIWLKGKNFAFFDNKLLDNIKEKLKVFDCQCKKTAGRYLIENYDEDDEEAIIEELQTVFGVHSISPAIKVETSDIAIREYISSITFSENTFRVSVNRADKRFEYTSQEYGAKLGGIILSKNHEKKVDLHNPDINISVDIRENGYTFIYYKVFAGVNGMPVGVSGKGLLLLSGGIDSPVAGYMMAKRGMNISALHFHSYPYTSELAKQKVLDLAKILSRYAGHITLYTINFKEVQESIHKFCNEEFMITLMRRIMMRIAEIICDKYGCEAIITGEALAQVASQTIQSITVTNKVVETKPILRPLIGFDKEEITAISKKMNAFNTSILPYEDCCTVFLPKHPLIKPRIDKCEAEESKLNIEELISNALATLEIVEI